MHWNNTKLHYGLTTKALHWAVVLLIFTQFALGMSMASLAPNSIETVWGFTKTELMLNHQSFGVLLLLTVIARIAWRQYSTLPDWAESLSKGDRKYAHIVERALYLLMFITPLSGLMLVMTLSNHVNFFGAAIPSILPHNEALSTTISSVHAISRMLILLVFFMHIGFVLKHQFFNKDRLLNRMLP